MVISLRRDLQVNIYQWSLRDKLFSLSQVKARISNEIQEGDPLWNFSAIQVSFFGEYLFLLDIKS